VVLEEAKATELEGFVAEVDRCHKEILFNFEEYMLDQAWRLLTELKQNRD